MNSSFDLSVCILATDDAEGLQLTAASGAALGPVVVGVPEGSAPVPVDLPVITVPLALDDSVGQAWNRLLQAAPHDRCLLLQPGEVVLAGDPASDTSFAPSIIVDHPDAYEPPDRLGAIRLVDRRHGRLLGRLRPVVDHEGPYVDTTGSVVIVDTGMRRGPAYEAWIHYLGAGLDESEDPAELVDLATLLALTGEHDAAITRLFGLMGALSGDLGRRAARLLSYCAVRRGRRPEAVTATIEWERLEPNPGPALALRGAALAGQQLFGYALPLLEAGLTAGLADSDGVTVDRTWIESLISEARQRVGPVEGTIAREIYTVGQKSSLVSLFEAWTQLGRPLDQLLSMFNDASARMVRTKMFEALGNVDSLACLEYAEHLVADGDGISTQVVQLVESAVSRGDVDLPTARLWSERMRAAGRTERCTLVSFAGTPVGAPVARVLAAAELIERHGHPMGPELLDLTVRSLQTAAIPGVLHRIADDWPGALGAFLEAAARSSTRRETLAVTLERGGVPELAEQLRAR